MAHIAGTRVVVTVQLDVVYDGQIPLDERRREYIAGQLQAFADGKLRQDLRELRYNDEKE
ncbi:MAG TPA: hypothetical protein VG328_17970 [Stellaceae bacterium]|nr:hypothetical protein [Stellaceae bacterium]